jgi:hypothetical protein
MSMYKDDTGHMLYVAITSPIPLSSTSTFMLPSADSCAPR